jgi:hypothetical protein
MDCSQWTAFAKYPQLMAMDPNQTDEYMIKLQSLLIKISPMPLPQQASKLHDFFMTNAAMICMQRADKWHLQSWEHKSRGELEKQMLCGQLRDEAVACKNAIRAHLHAGGAA